MNGLATGKARYGVRENENLKDKMKRWFGSTPIPPKAPKKPMTHCPGCNHLLGMHDTNARKMQRHYQKKNFVFGCQERNCHCAFTTEQIREYFGE